MGFEGKFGRLVLALIRREMHACKFDGELERETIAVGTDRLPTRGEDGLTMGVDRNGNPEEQRANTSPLR